MNYGRKEALMDGGDSNVEYDDFYTFECESLVRLYEAIMPHVSYRVMDMYFALSGLFEKLLRLTEQTAFGAGVQEGLRLGIAAASNEKAR